MQMAERPSSGEILQVAELFRKGCESLRRKAAEKQREVLGLFFFFFLVLNPGLRCRSAFSRRSSAQTRLRALGGGMHASPPALPPSLLLRFP